MISQRIFEILKEKGIKQKELAIKTGISESAISDWKKKNTNPAAEHLSVIADFLGVSLDYLIRGHEKVQETNDNPLPHKGPIAKQYRCDFPEKTEIDKKYNRVCYAMYILCDSIEASALLSAARVVETRTHVIEDSHLEWLAAHINTSPKFFNDKRIMGRGHSELRQIADEYMAIEVENVIKRYPFAQSWEDDFEFSYISAFLRSTKREYISEIIETFKKYNDEQGELMTYIRFGIKEYEKERENRYSKRTFEINTSLTNIPKR